MLIKGSVDIDNVGSLHSLSSGSIYEVSEDTQYLDRFCIVKHQSANFNTGKNYLTTLYI